MLRHTKIVCTIGRIDEKDLEATIRRFVEAGMDVARINMAHYNVTLSADKDYLRKLIRTIRKEAEKARRAVAVLGDIQGPKVRIKELLGKDKLSAKIRLNLGEEFILTSSESVDEKKRGASIKYESKPGHFNFFSDIEATAEKDDHEPGKFKPIEFWFGDGRVILQTPIKNVTHTSAICQVKVAGEIKKGQGVSVKNATIRPGDYDPKDYEKDRKDIEFVLEQEVDFLALSFVNKAKDVENLTSFIANNIGMKPGQDTARKPWLRDFPIISKIETPTGCNNLEEIMNVSYGILVARGDLALRTGIAKVGILQKEIIEKCVDRGKPVITATQMLLSMMDFIEPRRSEVADVTNAIQDGSDALMLSEETADPDSKYKTEAIMMMSNIIMETEKRRSENRVDYKHDIDRLHEKALNALDSRLNKLQGLKSRMYPRDYEQELEEFHRIENIEHVSYDACKTAFELKCSAIVVLTDTGGTARMISRFGPDAPIFAGVYDDRTARIMRLSYGVEPFVIASPDPQRNPFNEFEEVIQKAKGLGLLRKGDRVIQVAGYPQGQPGTTTFLNLYEVREEHTTLQ